MDSADFGLSRQLTARDGGIDGIVSGALDGEGCDTDPFAQTACGTPYYMAPEQINGKPYSRPVDLCALAVLASRLLATQSAVLSRLPWASRVGGPPSPRARWTHTHLNELFLTAHTRKPTDNGPGCPLITPMPNAYGAPCLCRAWCVVRWALGCVLFELLCLRRAFSADGFAELAAVISRGDYHERELAECPHLPGLRELATRRALLNAHPRERMTISQLLVRLRELLAIYVQAGGDPHNRARAEAQPPASNLDGDVGSGVVAVVGLEAVAANAEPAAMGAADRSSRSHSSRLELSDVEAAAVSQALLSADRISGDCTVFAGETPSSASSLSPTATSAGDVRVTVREDVAEPPHLP